MNTIIAIAGLGILCLALEIFNFRKAIVPITVAGLLAILGLTVSQYNIGGSHYSNMIVIDNYSIAFSSLFIILTIFLVTMSDDFYRAHPTRLSDYISLKIFLLLGAVAMVSFGNLAMFFLGIEILSIALYVLAASNRLSLRSNEAGMKYFLMGAFASGIILFGICLIYGAMGTFDVGEISGLTSSAELPDKWFFSGVALLLIGMFFKIAAVPFHFWAPDVYEGSPTLTTATMSALTKIVAMAALYKLIAGMNVPFSYSYEMIVAVVAVASMILGNIMALRQGNVKRMLAFSGISHAGFMLMALLSIPLASGMLLYYAAAYATAGIAAFAVVIAVCGDRDNEVISSFNGLGRTQPLLAGVLTAAMLSMAGIPIFAGFFAKFMLFTQTIQSGYIWVVIIAVISSIISVGYYFKLIMAMYSKEPAESTLSVHISIKAVAVLAIVLNIILGLFPSLLTGLVV